MPPEVLASRAATAPGSLAEVLVHPADDWQPGLRPPRPHRGFRLPISPTSVGLVAVLVVAALLTGLNLFGSPHYESDEGTYVGSAWSMFQEGKLSYYTYNYDHPPFGWLVIGLWVRLVGGFLAFGSSIDTARVLMWVACLISTFLTFEIVRRATRSLGGAVLGAVVFAASPLGVPLHRQVWLDNLSTAWLLLALYLLLDRRAGLWAVLLSAIAFALGFWTKEVMIVFLPAMLVIVRMQAHAEHRRFALTLWFATTIAVVSLFVLLAWLKDEFLPPGVLWSSALPHVSLLDTYSWQMSRGGAGSALSTASNFRQFFDQWRQSDPLLVLGGIASGVLGLLLIRVRPLLGGIGLLGLIFLLFLARGGVVLYYYIIPLLAVFAVGLGLLCGYALQRLRQVSHLLGAVMTAGLLIGAGYRVQDTAQALAARGDLSEHPTAAQDAAAAWMLQNLSSDSVVLMDSYAWVEMRDPELTGGKPFVNAHYYWPAVSDPSVRDTLLENDWRSIDYVAASPSLESDIANRDLPILPDAMRNADEIQNFFTDNWTVRILRVRKLNEKLASSNPFLTQGWATFKEHYLRDGQVVDPRSGRTTSEAQADTLLRAVYSDDQATFDQVWQWTRANLQVRQSDALLAWSWGHRADGTAGILSADTATGADEDTALALLFAARRWNQAGYQSDALQLISDIWNHETAVVDGRPVIVGGTGAAVDAASGRPDPVVHPSALAPYAYRIFREVDPGHPWGDLVDSSYDILSRIGQSPQFGGEAGVVPNWVALDAATGDLKPAAGRDDTASQFNSQASRVQWRLALDWLWYTDDRAKGALRGISLPNRQLTSSRQLVAAYTVDGQPAASYQTTSMYATSLAGLLVAGDRDLALSVFASSVFHTYRTTGRDRYWGDLDDFDDQNWGWFATALVDGGIANLWPGETVVNWDRVLP